MRWVWSIVLAMLAILAMLASPASADDAADQAEAGREFAAGQAADRRKDWPTAIQHYVRANDLLPHPNAMFNIASDYEKLGNLRQAAVWYQRYVEAAGAAPDRDKVVKLLRELATRPTTLTVRTIPAGARVAVDGTAVGTTPYSGKIAGGRHRITFEYEGRVEHREISVDFAEPAVLDLTLRGESGTLRVVGPPGSVLVVDDMPAGSLPVSVELPPGPHAIKVTSYGYAPFETTATIAPNRETLLNAQMTRALGTVDGKRTIKAGYLVGVGGGADLRGNGGIGMVDLGVQALGYDVALRIGKAAGLTAVDLVVRWAIGTARIAPYVGAGYAFVKSGDDGDTSASPSTGSGYVLMGGLRYEVSRGEHSTIAIVAESGLRIYAATSGTEATTVIPLMASVQLIYK